MNWLKKLMILRILIASDLVKKADCNTLIVDYKYLIVNNIKTNDISDLSKKGDYDIKTSTIEKKIFDYNHNEFITTQKFNNLTLVQG